jgi:hypothetical protein
MYNSHASYKSHTMVLLLEMGLAPLFPSTMQNLDICSYDVLLSCIAYTKQLLFSLFPYSSSIERSDYSDPPSNPLLLDMFTDNGFLPVVGMLVESLPHFGTFVVSKDTSSVVTMSSQISAYVACQ